MKDWSASRVLVTGATGMIGSWLVKALLETGAAVAVLVQDADPQTELYRSGDIQRVTVINGSLEEFATLERAVNVHEVDTVFHLGAQTIVGAAYRFPLPTFEANIRGTYNLLEVCRLHQSLVRRVVIASSDKAYGEQERLPYTEESPLAGRHPYDVSKSCCDMLAQSYHHTYGLPIGIARCGNVYGGGDLNWSRIVPGTIRSLLRREPPVLRSDGKYLRDYIYVKDVAQAYLRLGECLEDPRVCGQAFNFSLERPVSVVDLVKEIQQLMDCRIEPRILNEARAEIRSQHLSAAKAREILGWSCRFNFQEGLRETIRWYQSFLQ